MLGSVRAQFTRDGIGGRGRSSLKKAPDPDDPDAVDGVVMELLRILGPRMLLLEAEGVTSDEGPRRLCGSDPRLRDFCVQRGELLDATFVRSRKRWLM